MSSSATHNYTQKFSIIYGSNIPHTTCTGGDYTATGGWEFVPSSGSCKNVSRMNCG